MYNRSAKTIKILAAVFSALAVIAAAGPFLPAFGAGKVTNVATVRYRDAHGNVCDPVSASAETPIADGPNVRITVSSDNEMAAMGSVIAYRLIYENSGNQDAANVKIENFLSKYVKFSDAAGGTYDPSVSENGSIKWSVGTVKSGTKGTLSFNVAVKKPSDYSGGDPGAIKDGDAIVDRAKISSGSLSNDNVYRITVGERPLLKITIAQSVDALKPGEQIAYTIKYENAGNAKATNVVVKNEVPELTSYVENSITNVVQVPRAPSAAPLPPAGMGAVSGRTLIWNVGTLGPNQAGTASFKVKLTPLAKSGQSVTDVAVISGAEQSAVSSSLVVATVLNDHSATLALSASAARVVSGDTITYTAEASNNGGEDLKGLILKNKLPANLTFISASGGGRLVGSEIIWSFPLLKPGEKRTFSFSAKVSDAAAAGDGVTVGATLNSPDLASPVASESRVAVVDLATLSGLEISMTSNKNNVFVGETVRFTMTVVNSGAVTVSGAALRDTLPTGLDFVRGSVIADGLKYADPAISSGGRLEWALRDLTPGAKIVVDFTARVALASGGEALNSARASGTYLGRAISTNIATVKLIIKEGVFSSRGIIVGRVFYDRDGDGRQGNDPCGGDTSEAGVANARLVLDDGTWVVTDEKGKYSISNVSPGTRVLRLDASTLPPGLLPAPVRGAQSGSAGSMFVELGQSMTFAADFPLTGTPIASGSAGSPKKDQPPSRPPSGGPRAAEPEYLKAMATMTPEPGFVNLRDGEVISSNNIPVVVKAPKDLAVKLFVNGVQVPSERVGRKSVSASNAVAVYEFIGVGLKPGAANSLRLDAADPFGNERGSKEISIKTVGEPASLFARASRKAVPADGSSEVEICAGFLDRDGNRVRMPARFNVECDAGEIRNPDEDPAVPGSQVTVSGDDSPIVVAAPRETGKGKLTVSYNGMEASCDIDFVPELKPPLTVGVGEVSVGSGRDSDVSGVLRKARGSFFTKGKFGRDMQLTMSYDSHKPRRDELFRQSDTDVSAEDKYPIWGDASVTGFDAVSREKLFLRLDRRMSTLLYGDFYTGLDDNRLLAYNRMFNGAKLVINEGRAAVDSFVSRTNKTQVVDRFRGRGISGYYNLSNARVTPGSEIVVVETRSRFQPDIVLKREVKIREQDYTLDYDLGFVLFKSEIPSVDSGFNPVFLIVSYEAEGFDDRYYIYGGRGSVKLGRFVELGVTDIRERQTAGDRRLGGFDLAFRGKNDSLKLEWAGSESMAMVDNVLSRVDGGGFSAELSGKAGKKLEYKGFFKTAGDHFDNPSAYDVMAGTRRFSLDATYAMTKRSYLRGSYFKQNDTLNSMYYEHASVGVAKTYEKTRLSLDVMKEKSSDGFIPATRLRTRHPFDISEQTPKDLTAAELIAERPINSRVTLSGRSKLDIAHNAYNISMAGVDYKLAKSAKLYLRGERARFDDLTDRRTILGAESDVFKNTTAFSEYRLGDASSGERLQKSIGLRNRFELGPKATGNVSVERLDTLKGPELLMEPDALAVAAGVEYLPAARLKMTGRFEKRKASIEDSYLNEFGAAYGFDGGVSLLFRERLFKNWQTAVGKSSSLRTILGLAFRPVYFDRFNALLRLELKQNLNPSASAGFDDDALIYSLEGTYRLGRAANFTGKYAAKKDRAPVFGGITDLLAGKFVLDVSRNFDFGLEYRVMDSRATGSSVRGALYEFGYRVKDDIWLSVGHSMKKFDSDLTGDNFEGKGPYARVRFKFDEGLFGRRRSK